MPVHCSFEFFWLGFFGIYLISLMTENLPLINIPEMLGNNTLYCHCWAFTIINACVGVLGCIVCNFSKLFRRISPIIYVIVICFQVMVVTELYVWWEHWESICESMWKELDPHTVNKIEETLHCCSFNGTDTFYTWAADVEEYANCTATYSWDPMETCWRKLYDAMNKRDESGWNGKTLPTYFACFIAFVTGFFFLVLWHKEKIVELSRHNNATPNRTAQCQTSGTPVEVGTRML